MWLEEIAQKNMHRNVYENKIALSMLSRNPDWIGCQQKMIECETGDLYVREL